MLSCSVPFVQTNVQLLATCYLHNNQPYAAYHILKGNRICPPYYHSAVHAHYCVVMSLWFDCLGILTIGIYFPSCGDISYFAFWTIFLLLCWRESSVDDLWILFLLYYEGKKLPESRYLFAMSCFRMNLLHEAEDTLCPVNEPNIEVCSVFVKRFVYVVAN